MESRSSALISKGDAQRVHPHLAFQAYRDQVVVVAVPTIIKTETVPKDKAVFIPVDIGIPECRRIHLLRLVPLKDLIRLILVIFIINIVRQVKRPI